MIDRMPITEEGDAFVLERRDLTEWLLKPDIDE